MTRPRLLTFALIPVSLAAVAALFLFTAAGLRIATNLLIAQVPGTLKATTIEGSLRGPIRLGGINYETTQGLHVTVDAAYFDWDPVALLGGRLHITELRAKGVRIVTGQGPSDRGLRPSPLSTRVPIVLGLFNIEHLEATGFPILDRAQGAISYVDAQLRFDRLRLQTAEVELKLDGTLTTEADYPGTFTLAWRWLPARAKPLSGTASLRGDLAAYTFELDLIGGLKARGQVSDLLGEFGWNAKITADNWRVSNVLPAWPLGAIAGEIFAHGDLGQVQANGRLGDAQGATVGASFDLRYAQGAVAIRHLTLTTPVTEGRLDLTGTLLTSTPQGLRYNLAGHWRDVRYPGWTSEQGTLSMQGDLTRLRLKLHGEKRSEAGNPKRQAPFSLVAEGSHLDTDAPRLNAKLHLPSLRYDAYQVDGLDGSAALHFAADGLVNLDLKVGKIQLPHQTLRDVQLGASGTLAAHRLSLRAMGGEVAFATAVKGRYAARAWDGVLETLTLGMPTQTHWRLHAPTALRLSTKSARLDPACLDGARQKEVCIDAQWTAASGWSSALKVDRLELMPIASAWRKDFNWVGQLSGEIDIQGDASIRSGHVKLHSPCCSVGFKQADNSYAAPYRDLELEMKLDASGFKGQFRGVLPGQGRVAANMTLVGTSTEALMDHALSATARIDLDTLQTLQPLLPALRLQGGEASLHITAAGTLRAPQLRGSASIVNAGLNLPGTGTQLTDVQIDVHAAQENRLVLSSSARAGQGSLRVQGSFDWHHRKAWQAELALTGKGAEVLKLPEIYVVATPNLDIRFSPERIDVRGKVYIDHAKLSPELALASDLIVSPDFRLVDATPDAQASVLMPHAQVQIDLGKDTQVQGYGLNGRLRGVLDIRQAPGKITTASGEINISDGRYRIYGQDLMIKPGRLLFAGGSLDDPGIDVRALRTSGEVTAGVIARGTLRTPQISLYSQPTLPDADVLSYILLGRASNSVSGGEEAALLMVARDKYFSNPGTSNDQTRWSLGLEAQTNAINGSAKTGTALVLGKQLSPRLFISYATALAGAANLFRLRYQLSKHWWLQTETSSRQSGGDLQYTIEH